MIHMAYEINVVNDNLVSNLFDYTCLFSIGCKLIMITT
jgi:hypothetical protein